MEHKKLFVALVALFAGACSGTVAQPPVAQAHSIRCAGGTVQSDADLERYEGCTTIVGDLRVRDVTGLESLSSLQSVTGTLEVGPTRALYDLSGLEELRSVGELVLQRNAVLVSAGSLNGLTDAARIQAHKNPRLSKTFGFMKNVNHDTCRFELSHNVGLEAEGVGQDAQPKARTLLGML
jgi:hypothetical protein